MAHRFLAPTATLRSSGHCPPWRHGVEHPLTATDRPLHRSPLGVEAQPSPHPLAPPPSTPRSGTGRDRDGATGRGGPQLSGASPRGPGGRSRRPRSPPESNRPAPPAAVAEQERTDDQVDGLRCHCEHSLAAVARAQHTHPSTDEARQHLEHTVTFEVTGWMGAGGGRTGTRRRAPLVRGVTIGRPRRRVTPQGSLPRPARRCRSRQAGRWWAQEPGYLVVGRGET